MKYSKERAMEQIAATSLKSRKLPLNTVLTLSGVTPGHYEQNGKEVANDTLICETADGIIKIPVREFMKMKNEKVGEKLYSAEEGSKDVDFPGKVEIVAAEDRLDRNNNVIMPTFAYNRADDFFAGKIQWDDLVASGTKAGQTFDPVQNYTVAVL